MHPYLLYGDWHQAQDAAQDALVAAYQQWEPKVASRTEGERWLFILRVLANRQVSSLRRMNVHGKALTLLHTRVSGSQSIVHVKPTFRPGKQYGSCMRCLPGSALLPYFIAWKICR